MFLTESIVEQYLSPEEASRLDADAGLRADFIDAITRTEVPEFDEPELDTSFKTALVVVGLPVVASDKLAKLTKIVKGLFDKFGQSDLELPIDESTGKTYGMAIVTFAKAADANKALRGADRFKLDEQHIFRVYHVDDVPSFFEQSESSSAKDAASRFDRSDLRDFMADSQLREQLLVRFQSETNISWFDPLDSAKPMKLEYGGERDKQAGRIWCDGRVIWSPRGSYLATIHSGRGIVLWGGDKFQKKTRFVHATVGDVCFSESEEYVMLVARDLDDPEGVKIYNVMTGELCRALPMSLITNEEFAASQAQTALRTGPLDGNFSRSFYGFSWSASGAHLSKNVDGQLVVYEGPQFRAKLDSVGKLATAKYSASTAEFSPANDLLAIWTPEAANSPGRLAVVDVSTMREVASKTMFSTIPDRPVQILWHPAGEYVALRTARQVKGAKAGAQRKVAVGLDVLSLRQRNTAPFTVDLGADVSVKALAWEPTSGRMAALLETEVTKPGEEKKPRLVVWKFVGEKAEQVAELPLTQGSYSAISWSPQGSYMLLWDDKHMSGGDIMWCLLPIEGKQVEILRNDNHFLVNQVEWDASGRYLLTAVVQRMHDDSQGAFRYQQEASYTVWSFQGRQLHAFKKEKLWGVSWRPHCESALSHDDRRKAVGELKMREKAIEEDEEKIRGESKRTVQRAMQAKRDSYLAALDKVDAFYNARLA